MPGPFYSRGQLALVFGAGSIYPSGNNFSPFSKKVLKDFGVLVVNYYLRIGTKAANLTSREDLRGFHKYLLSLIIRVAVVEAVNLLCFIPGKQPLFLLQVLLLPIRHQPGFPRQAVPDKAHIHPAV